MEAAQERTDQIHHRSRTETAGFLSALGNIKTLRQVVQRLVFLGLPLTGCIPEKTTNPTPVTYEQKKEHELKDTEPTSEEIQYFLDVFEKHPTKEFVEAQEEKWVSDKIKNQLAQGFARLSKTLKIEPKLIGEDLSYVLENTKIVLRKAEVHEDLYAEVDKNGSIEIYPKAKKDAAEIIFHEYLHMLLITHESIEFQFGLKNVYYLLEEGSTQLMTKMAFPESCDTVYPSATLLVAALGPDFYKTRILDIPQYLKTSTSLGATQLENPTEMKKLLEAFIKRWNLKGENILTELADIFGVPEVISRQNKPSSKLLDLDDKKQDYHRALRLRAVLQRQGLDWYEFLKEISPPNNNFARDWKIIMDIDSDDWKQQWRKAIQCEETKK